MYLPMARRRLRDIVQLLLFQLSSQLDIPSCSAPTKAPTLAYDTVKASAPRHNVTYSISCVFNLGLLET